MARTAIAVVFAGSGGAGAMTAGAVFLRAAAHAGYYGMMTQLFGAQVRGGEAAALVQISTEPIECQPDRYDLFVALGLGQGRAVRGRDPARRNQHHHRRSGGGRKSPASIAKSKARTVPLPR